MPITRDTLALIRGMRIAINAEVDQATRTITQRWVLAWDTLSAEWRDAIDDVLDLIEDGRWPTQAQIARLSRVRQALGTTLDALADLADDAAVIITDSAGDAIDMAGDWQTRILGSQMPDDTRGTGVRWDRTDPEALRALVDRIAGQVTSLMFPLSGEATDAMYRALVRGVAAGQNPRTVARLMLQRLESAFNGGLARALTIARTEILTAYRESAQIAREANRDVVKGWRWACDFSSRTCPACLSKHGSVHPVGEFGPNGHPNCRCTAVPITKSWKELGFDQPEPAGRDWPSAEDWFDGLSDAQKVEIMGKERLALLVAGEIDFSDLAVLRRSPQWMDHWTTRPVGELVNLGA